MPAIKEAGFEPVRADELFTTGSVMEQIWDQIEKAKLLLADLSEKNANVFYELGLAHAARKPVVFTASNVEDVPFDLRHLRVIIYDIREPEWAPRLRESIADYLRNAMKEREKCIPHPFRKIAELKIEQSTTRASSKELSAADTVPSTYSETGASISYFGDVPSRRTWPIATEADLVSASRRCTPGSGFRGRLPQPQSLATVKATARR